jgi:hypothetical protein
VNRRRIITLALLAAVALVACGDDNETVPVVERPGDGDGIEHPTGADALVVRVATGGGFVPSTSRLAEIPELAVYGDGRAIVVGPTTLEFPGPALPNLQQGSLNADELQELLRAADVAGLFGGEEPDYGDPGVTDMPTTTVTINAGGVERTVSAYALAYEDGDDDLAPEQREARERLREFIAVVDADVATESYEADSVAVFVRPYDPDESTEPSTTAPHPWPLGDLAGAGEPYEGFSDTRCLVVAGADAETVLAAAGDARDGDPWRVGDVDYALVFRPLLPDESSCADLSPGQVGGA